MERGVRAQNRCCVQEGALIKPDMAWTLKPGALLAEEFQNLEAVHLGHVEVEYQETDSSSTQDI